MQDNRIDFSRNNDAIRVGELYDSQPESEHHVLTLYKDAPVIQKPPLPEAYKDPSKTHSKRFIIKTEMPIT